ncbi:hypothetical protein L596_001486 [Steinernema carpocapsae]|uniref:Uncharacterized protein n=1 Tax=Steinernema carpocapsae TaxID=34508 RepID=A0A4U8UME6_STECR|nr:hypothetical protein L596_001486 [Steinernema carpocapsae]
MVDRVFWFSDRAFGSGPIFGSVWFRFGSVPVERMTFLCYFKIYCREAPRRACASCFGTPRFGVVPPFVSNRRNFASIIAPRSNVYDFFDEIEGVYKSKDCEILNRNVRLSISLDNSNLNKWPHHWHSTH